MIMSRIVRTRGRDVVGLGMFLVWIENAGENNMQ
ncbi:hypothetical protein APED_04380 [Acanthopleuribacter pedis]